MSNRTVIEGLEKEMARTKKLCEGALAQVDDGGLHARISERQTSLAAIVQHLAGNMESRFTDFLTSDGEKPTRDREGELQDRNLPRAELMAMWERGWKCVFSALAALTDADLGRVVYIRKEPHTVALALVRQLGHQNWHAGQIALLAKHQVGAGWKYLTIAPGGTAAFNSARGV